LFVEFWIDGAVTAVANAKIARSPAINAILALVLDAVGAAHWAVLCTRAPTIDTSLAIVLDAVLAAERWSVAIDVR
jgi:hypothetical protein